MTTSKKSSIVKPVWVYEIVNIYGPSVLTTEGETWKRHRSVCNPAFSEDNLRLVAKSTSETLNHMFKELDPLTKDGHRVNTSQYILDATMAVISESAFGLKLSLFSGKSSDKELTDMMHQVTKSFIAYALTPKWLYYFPIKRVHKLKKFEYL